MTHFGNTLYRSRRRYTFGVALLLATSIVGNVCAEPFPSTLQDYVTLYQIKSYQHFQHDSSAYQARLAKSKDILSRMKKQKGKSAEAAAKQWFMAAVATPASLPAIPAFEYLTDTDRTVVAKKDQPDKSETRVNASNEPAEMHNDAWHQGSFADIAESLEQSDSERESQMSSTETPAEFDWNAAESADSTDTQNMDTFASNESESESQDSNWDNTNQDTSQAVASALAALKSAAAGTGAMSESGAAVASKAMDSAANGAASAKQSAQDLAAKVWGEANDGPAQEPFAETKLKEVGAEEVNAFDDFAQAENELAKATEHWGSGGEINAKIGEFNSELNSVRSDMRVAFGGDGSQIEPIVSRIEDLTETRSGLQAVIDLSGNSSNHEPIGNLVSLMDEFRNSMKDLKLVIANAEKSDKAITIEESETLLQRVEDVVKQAEAFR